jgi:aminobutyraldehyde dehydrogenase
VAPTVLIDVTNDHEVAREEIFGPVVTVEKFSDEEEAVRRANAVPYPPTAARTPASLARSRWRGTNWHDCRQLSCATSATRERR